MSHALKFALVLLVAATLAGCDRCGDWLKPQFPSLPKTCTGTGTGTG